MVEAAFTYDHWPGCAACHRPRCAKTSPVIGQAHRGVETWLLREGIASHIVFKLYQYLLCLLGNYNKMVDVNEPVSRAFSLSLRFFQLGLQLLVAQLISKISNDNCSQTLLTIGLPISYIFLGINLVAILVIHFKKMYNRKVFFTYYAANIILAGVVMVVGLGGIGETNSCANNRVVHRFAGFQSLITIVVSVLVLFGPFEEVIRFANAPGNLVWPFLFFGNGWTDGFRGAYAAVGVIYLLITLVSFGVNVLSLKGGMTALKQKIVRFWWIGALAIMVICEIIVLVTLISQADTNQFNDAVAKKLAQTFLPVNIIDALFWVWGLLTLQFSNGDAVRQNIMRDAPNDDENDLDNLANGPGIGTLKTRN